MIRRSLLIALMLFAYVSIFQCTDDNATTEESTTDIETAPITITEGDGEPEFLYRITDGKLTIVEVLNTGSTLVIPSSIDGNQVYELKNQLFTHNQNLVHVTLPSGLQQIGVGAFLCCSSLLDISIPSGIKGLPQALFSGCTSLESVYLPYGLERIHSLAFANCTSLESIYIPASVTYIAEDAFSGCSGMTIYLQASSVTIRDEEAGIEEGFDAGWNAGNQVVLGASR